jgi:hypothetical protein
MTVTYGYFAAGSTLANMVNLETVISPPSVLEGGRVPVLPPIAERALDGILTRSGKIPSRLKFTDATEAERVALNTLLFASQSVASIQLYMSLLAEDGHFNPYLVVADRPYELEQYTRFNDLNLSRDGLLLPLFDCRLQYLTKTANYTITTADHLVYFDTSGGSRTASLAALSGFNENVVYSVVKTSASNSLIIDPNGSETIDGASTKTVTALNARVDFIKRDGAWITV